MKDKIHSLLAEAVQQLVTTGLLSEAPAPDSIELSRTRDASHGDFASNIAMKLAKQAQRNPRELAQALVDALPVDPLIERTEIAGPGFINFHVVRDATLNTVATILEQKARYGECEYGKGQSIQVEFVSANPTGPLHVGHGRGAAYGAVVSNMLAAIGYEVEREYYVNDAGRQMHILAASVWLRYLELAGETLTFPSNGYQGDYVWDIGADLHREQGDAYRVTAAEIFSDIPADAPAGGDKELHIDAIIEKAQALLGPERYRIVFDAGLNRILEDIRQDLRAFGVEYDVWFSERSLAEQGEVDKAIAALETAGYVYEQQGALWFKSTEFGDEKDRVVRRENGQPTYFASDIAYHLNKMARGFDKVIDMWGADHHGYVARVRAALKALYGDDSKLNVLLVQFCILYRGGERAQMSTRSGEFVTLRELREEVGTDAARFFYVMRRHDQHLDFDLDLAKSQSNDNPVYYIQYAHARISSVLRQLKEKGLAIGEADLTQLTTSHENELITQLARYPELLKNAAIAMEPHQIANYLRELATQFHTYYNAQQFIVDDESLRNARLSLCLATQQVLKNGLTLLGVSAPEHM
ncbi:MAG: arginine--tRNA ligase [Thiotrichales bacterium]